MNKSVLIGKRISCMDFILTPEPDGFLKIVAWHEVEKGEVEK